MANRYPSHNGVHEPPNATASKLPNTKTFGMVTLLKVLMNKEYNNSCWKARTIDDSAKSQVNEEKTSCTTETCEHKFDHTGIKRRGRRPIGTHSFTRRNVCVRWMCVRAGMFSVCLVCFRYLYGFILKQHDERTDKHLSSTVQHVTPKLPASTPVIYTIRTHHWDSETHAIIPVFRDYSSHSRIRAWSILVYPETDAQSLKRCKSKSSRPVPLQAVSKCNWFFRSTTTPMSMKFCLQIMKL